jgi:hypothetical protein
VRQINDFSLCRTDRSVLVYDNVVAVLLDL